MLEGWVTIKNNSHSGTYSGEDFLIEDSLQSCYRVLLADPSEPELIPHGNEVCLDYITLVYIPNAFNPSGDGVNDTYKITVFGIESYQVNIYNRWGEKVYSGSEVVGMAHLRAFPCNCSLYSTFEI